MALSSTQKIILEELAKSPLKHRFYWSGGTLLAEKYLQHRHSYDVDLFTDQPFRYEEVLPLVQAVKNKGQLVKIEEKKIFDRWEFFLHNHSEVRCEFVRYDFKPLVPRKKWRGVMVDSLDDLAANKTMATFDRREPKDVVDIYYLMIQKKYSLTKLLRLAKKKFGITITPSTLISQILTTCGLLKTIKPMLLGSKSEQEALIVSIQSYFTRLSADFVHRSVKR